MQEQVYDISIDFGETRVFNFRKWKGHERRLLRENLAKDTLDNNTIADILVYGCMETPTYLNQDEVLYAIHILRKESFGTDIVVPFECQCGHEEDISISDICSIDNTTKQTLKDIVLEGKVFSLKQPQLDLHLIGDLRQKNHLEQLYYELLMHIDYFVMNETKYDAFTTKDLDTFFDTSLSISEFDEAINQFSDMRFAFNPSVDIECKECKEKSTIVVDYIDEIFN